MLSAVLVDFLLIGVAMATACWYVIPLPVCRGCVRLWFSWSAYPPSVPATQSRLDGRGSNTPALLLRAQGDNQPLPAEAEPASPSGGAARGVVSSRRDGGGLLCIEALTIIDVPLRCCRLYAFDVHCNSYFPLFLLLYGKSDASLWK